MVRILIKTYKATQFNIKNHLSQSRSTSTTYQSVHPIHVNGFGHPKGLEQVGKFDTTHQSRARASQCSSLQIQPNIYEVPLVSYSHLIDIERSNLLTASVISCSKLIWKHGMALV